MRDEWAGLPVPIDGETLIVEPSHPASVMYRTLGKGMIHGRKLCSNEDVDEEVAEVNNFWSTKRKGHVFIWREGNGNGHRPKLRPDGIPYPKPEKGETKWAVLPDYAPEVRALGTMGCSYAWSFDAEWKALALLSDLIPPHLFQMYFLTGMFPTTSDRSGITYIFRKLRPTIAMVPRKLGYAAYDRRQKVLPVEKPIDPTKETMNVLCCLCLHPIGYYEDTWAGSMVPTDDVIAHFLLMRGDERMFWKRANHIPAWRAGAGLGG